MRRVDIGAPLLLVDPPGTDADLFTVETGVCANPECDCTIMGLFIRPARRISADRIELLEAELRGEVSSDGGGLELELDDRDGTSVPSAVCAWIRDRLSDDEHRAWFRERWQRLRGQVGDPAYPPKPVPADVDGLVAFDEVFPYEFDLTIKHEQRAYLAVDQYCVNPGCSCDDVALQFVDLSRDEPGEAVGAVRASVRRAKATMIDGPPIVGKLWRCFLDRHGREPLRDRYERMREAVRPRTSPAAKSPAAKVGRNDTCPCGSGRKFKRCCGA